MSSSTFARAPCRHASARHFYAIVAVSCCALLPMSVAIADQTAGADAAPALSTPAEKPAQPPEQAAQANTARSEEKEAATNKDDSAKNTQSDTESGSPEATGSSAENEKEDDDIAWQEEEAEPTPVQDTAESKEKEEKKEEKAPAADTTAATDVASEKHPGADSAVNFATAGNSLRKQAAHYRKLVAQWQPIAPGAPLRAGDQGPRVAQLRNLLELFGDYHGLPGPVTGASDNLNRHTERFDAGLQLAVESYQRRHGMVVTGIVDKATLKELARSPEELARVLEINAERWDKLPDQPGQRYILVNVPDYQLQLIDRQRVVLSMKTVVGKSSKRTPDLTTKLVSVVFNPTWTVPRSILLTDLLPKARNNPEAMHKRGYRVVKYGTNTTTPISDESIQSAAKGKATLRQISGPGNTLGRVKFVIPNKQAIFLHDTQAQSLFEHQHRAYSHGCIRLQEPEELAYALLGPQGWDRTRVAQATTGDESVTIKVDNPPRLFIAYLTAWVDALGKVHFRPDIYHRDD